MDSDNGADLHLQWWTHVKKNLTQGSENIPYHGVMARDNGADLLLQWWTHATKKPNPR
jgi:hypothetical protein